jgi:hypothetical protein
MPALSQNLIFTINSTSSVSANYPNTATGSLTYLSNKTKGSGYYGNSNGFHTIQIKVNNFVGKFEVQASLAADPIEADWFSTELGTTSQTIDTTGLLSFYNVNYVSFFTATSITKAYNVLGNFVWLRVKISEFSEGSVNSIKINF